MTIRVKDTITLITREGVAKRVETKVSKLNAFWNERKGHTPVAERDLLLTWEGGSSAHGFAVEGQDDLDAYSIYLEPPDAIFGLAEAKSIMMRTQPEGTKSGPGDIDWTLHPLQKYMKLAAGGNPTILMGLFAPVLPLRGAGFFDGAFTIALRSRGREALISKKAGNAFLGYMTAQRVRLDEGRSMRVNRPELIEMYGYDTKYAAHALRLGMQGIELMTYGTIAVPMQSPHLELVQEIRNGGYGKLDALRLLEEYEFRLIEAVEKSPAPDYADMEWVNNFLRHVYLTRYAEEAGGYR